MLEIISADASCAREFELAKRWLADHQADLHGRLLDCGALLFRGFSIDSVEQFGECLEPLTGPDEARQDYVGGISPREKRDGPLYSATEAPRFVSIPLHHEMAYLPRFPTKIAFFCRDAATTGGETPLADARRVLAEMPDEIRARFAAQRVVYERTLPGNGLRARSLGRLHPAAAATRWTHVYEGMDPPQIEKRCQTLGQAYEWLPNGDLRTRATVPPIRHHPITGESVWFNTAHTFVHEKHMFGAGAGHAIRWLRRIGGATFDLSFEDGTRLSEEIALRIQDVIDRQTHRFHWQPGDLLLLDNYLCMHGRTPYTGTRNVYAGLIGPR